MQAKSKSDALWLRLSGIIAGIMGLHFPPERWPDLQRGLAAAAKDFGFDDVSACAGWLLDCELTKAQLQILASHLTISETYFFRENKTLDVLANEVLPDLIKARRGREQRVRIWSAACCTGEEAYSLAILLRQALPDIADWQVTILATDINPRSLRKAVAGVYSEWSFRDAPEGLKTRYFNRLADNMYAVIPEIKSMVTFEHLNLIDDVYPSLATNTNAMDVIFCRNVLMYFKPEQIRNVLERLRRSLQDGGWLAVSPSETSQDLFSSFTTRNFPGVILYQKSDAKPSAKETSKRFVFDTLVDVDLPLSEPFWATLPEVDLLPEIPSEPSKPVEPSQSPVLQAESLYEQGSYAAAIDVLISSHEKRRLEPKEFSLLARSLANLGQFSEALAWCDRWIGADKLDSAGHYLRAVILLEQSEHAQARRSLQRAIYLQPDFVLAHFALGNLARNNGKHRDADKHYHNALDRLAHLHSDDLLQESDGLTAGRLIETITALTTLESVQ